MSFNKAIIKSVVLLLAIFLFTNPNSVWGVYYIESVKNSKELFTPFAYLQYGPGLTDGVPMYLTSANIAANDQTIEIFNPHTRINNSTDAFPVFYNDTLQPFFNTYFLFNRFQEPVIPAVSNISLEMAPINNDPQYLVQTDIGQFIPLTSNDTTYLPSFKIPSDTKSGYYLMQLNVYFPEYKTNAHYANTINLVDREDFESLLGLYADTYGMMDENNGSENLTFSNQTSSNSSFNANPFTDYLGTGY